jgi:hypothetical protein
MSREADTLATKKKKEVTAEEPVKPMPPVLLTPPQSSPSTLRSPSKGGSATHKEYRSRWSPALVTSLEALADEIRLCWDEALTGLTGEPENELKDFLVNFSERESILRVISSHATSAKKLMELQLLLDPYRPICFGRHELNDASLKNQYQAAVEGNDEANKWIKTLVDEQILGIYAELTASRKANIMNNLLWQWRGEAAFITNSLPAEYRVFAEEGFAAVLPTLLMAALVRADAEENYLAEQQRKRQDAKDAEERQKAEIERRRREEEERIREEEHRRKEEEERREAEKRAQEEERIRRIEEEKRLKEAEEAERKRRIEEEKERKKEEERAAKEAERRRKAEEARRLKTIGEIFTFGNQNWLVLAVEGRKSLLISENIVETLPWNNLFVKISWEGCTLRKYLNGPYYDSLPKSLKARVMETINRSPDDDMASEFGIVTTVDKVFILSAAEAKTCFKNDADRVAYFQGESHAWWLRSPGNGTDYASFVWSYGNIDGGGSYVEDVCPGVRPAIWIDNRPEDALNQKGK